MQSKKDLLKVLQVHNPTTKLLFNYYIARADFWYKKAFKRLSDCLGTIQLDLVFN